MTLKERLEERFESMSFKFAWLSHKLSIKLFSCSKMYRKSIKMKRVISASTSING